MSGQRTAENLMQDLLDSTGAAIHRGDFDAFRVWVALPSVLETFDHRLRLETVEDARALFLRAVERRRSQGVTEMVRRCVCAAFTADGSIHATHETRYLGARGQLLRPAHAGFSVLRRAGAQWQIVLSQYAVEGSMPLNMALAERLTRPEHPIPRVSIP